MYGLRPREPGESKIPNKSTPHVKNPPQTPNKSPPFLNPNIGVEIINYQYYLAGSLL